MNGRDAAASFGQYAQLANEQVHDYDELAEEVRAATEAIRHERKLVALALAAIYLPELSLEAMAETERRTGFKGYTSVDRWRRWRRRRAGCRARSLAWKRMRNGHDASRWSARTARCGCPRGRSALG